MNEPKEIKKTNRFKGLFRTLLLWFLTLSLAPLIIDNLIHYQKTYTLLHHQAEDTLQIAAENKSSRVRRYFRDCLNVLLVEARRKNNRSLLKDLRLAHQKNGTKPAEFVKSPQWNHTAELYRKDIEYVVVTNEFSDFLVIDHQGNLLFSDKQNDDLGTNLFNGKYAHTTFGQSCRKAFENELIVFSDFERYAPAGHDPVCFIVTLLFDENGIKNGLLAVQLDSTRIDRIMHSRSGLAGKGEAYLVGSDLKMRSNSILENTPTILEQTVTTEQTLLWHKKYVQSTTPLVSGKPAAGTYTGRRGDRVLGLFKSIDIAGVPMAVLTEIKESEAFAGVTLQLNIALLTVLVIAILVIAGAYLVVKRITHPINRLSAGARRAAKGDYHHTIDAGTRDEIGELSTIFNNMLLSMREKMETIEANDRLKTGQMELTKKMRGQPDLKTLSNNIIGFLTPYLDAQVGIIYTAREDGHLEQTGAYAFKPGKRRTLRFEPGEGLVGQAAVEKKHTLVTDCPRDYLTIHSGFGAAVPNTILVYPLMLENNVKGIVELGTLGEFSPRHLEFLDRVAEGIAIALKSVEYKQ